MRPSLSVLCLGTFLLSFSGCGYSVSLSYLKERQGPESKALLQNVYLVVDPPAAPPAGSLKKSGLILEEELPTPVDMAPFIQDVARQLTESGGRLSAFRYAQAGSDPFVSGLNPSSILTAQFESPKMTQTSVEREQSRKVDGKWVNVKIQELQLSGSLPLTLRLKRPDGTEIQTARSKPESSKTFPNSESDKMAQHRSALVQSLVLNAGKTLLADSLPVSRVTRERTLYDVKKDTATTALCKEASRGEWNHPVTVWRERLAANPEEWRYAWNLGVTAENRRDFVEARHYYELSRKSWIAGGQKPSIDWDALFADLSDPLPLTVQAADTAQPWFNQRIAVLPFTDMTNSVDGPLNVRRLTREAILRKGYGHTLTIEEVDVALREQGFTQGGQLKATTPAQIADWLKADLLVYGDLDKFDEFTLGVAGWKRLSGSFKIWSRAKGDFLWEHEASVSRASHTAAEKKGEFVWSALQQLASSWVDKASGTPMAEESASFVQEILAGLPSRLSRP